MDQVAWVARTGCTAYTCILPTPAYQYWLVPDMVREAIRAGRGADVIQLLAQTHRTGTYLSRQGLLGTLAVCCALPDREDGDIGREMATVKRAAYGLVPVVCTTSADLEIWEKAVAGGWGSGRRRAVRAWYFAQPAAKLAAEVADVSVHLAGHKRRLMQCHMISHLAKHPADVVSPAWRMVIWYCRYQKVDRPSPDGEPSTAAEVWRVHQILTTAPPLQDHPFKLVDPYIRERLLSADTSATHLLDDLESLFGVRGLTRAQQQSIAYRIGAPGAVHPWRAERCLHILEATERAEHWPPIVRALKRVREVPAPMPPGHHVAILDAIPDWCHFACPMPASRLANRWGSAVLAAGGAVYGGGDDGPQRLRTEGELHRWIGGGNGENGNSYDVAAAVIREARADPTVKVDCFLVVTPGKVNLTEAYKELQQYQQAVHRRARLVVCVGLRSASVLLPETAVPVTREDLDSPDLPVLLRDVFLFRGCMEMPLPCTLPAIACG